MDNQEKEKLKNWCSKFFENDSKGFDIFDFNAECDMKLTLEENKTILREKISDFLNIYNQEQIKIMKKAETIMPKEQHNLLILQEVKKAEEQAELEFNKVLNKIAQQETTDLLEDVFYIPKSFAKMVASGKARGLFLFGEAGIGKTYSIIRAFKELNKPFVMLSGHITSLELYQFLFRHRKENIVLDDVNILENEQNLNLLKACLSDNSRIVQYHTSSPRLQAPDKFLFEGTIILLLNEKPNKSESLNAVESRILNYELKIDYETKIKVIYELTKQEYQDITLEERQEIAKWIKENTSKATENLNLRLLFQIFQLFSYSKTEWKRLAINLIKNDEFKILILQGMTEQEFIEKTGKSRATYYNYKKSLKV